MKHIDIDGITFIEQISGAKGEWYYGIDYEHGDLYEAEEQYKMGKPVRGRKLYLIHYPDGTVYCPTPKATGKYTAPPAYYEGAVYIAEVDFPADIIRIIRFDETSHEIAVEAEILLSSVKDCYNLRIDTAPLMLTRQCVGHNDFEIVWPERVNFETDDHDSFFLRDGDKLYFSRWHEEGDGPDYKYWEEIVVRNLKGEVTDSFPGDIQLMPNGEMWHLK
ncbi:MAG: hypothetical protein IKX87_10585 [Lachnospiraceae bacterium]|nr:hypothetical protein [Lachnospiraceae bacterium]